MKSFRVSNVRNVGLVWKIGALLLVTMLVIVVISGAGLYALTKQFAIQEAEGKIKDLLLQHKGIHNYISHHQKPAVYKLKEEDKLYDAYFSPELLSSSYMTRNIHKYYNDAREEAGLSELYYKLAANNPRNLINQADEFEEQLIQQFNADKSLQEYKSILTQDGKKFLYYALPFVANSEACMRCHSTPDVAPKDLVDSYGDVNGFGEKVGDIRAIISIRSPLTGEIEARNRVMFISLGGLLGGILLLFFVSVWLAVRSQVLKPLNKGVHFAKEITDGNLNARFDVDQQDEIGTLAVALSNMSDRLKTVIENIQQVSATVTTRSKDITEWAQMLSSGARSQAADFEQASASMEQITATIQQNTARAQQTEGIAVNAEKNAYQVREAVTKALQGMRDIADNISQTEDIARQTRMLSLNATIEAARAQEDGRGFGVVAAEVRSLAERSQTIASTINGLATQNVDITAQAGDGLGQLISSIEKTSHFVQEIAAASREQDYGANQINQAIQQLDQVTQQTATTSEKLTSMAEELALQAEQLQGTMAFFKGDDDQ